MAFIIFTEAINQFPFPPLWAVLFFLMLFTLGADSQFGTLEGVISSLIDLKVLPQLRKEMLSGMYCMYIQETSRSRMLLPSTCVYHNHVLTFLPSFPSALVCVVCFVLSLMFTHGAGNYIFQLFDSFAGNIPLLVIGLMECISISYVYGIKRLVFR